MLDDRTSVWAIKIPRESPEFILCRHLGTRSNLE